MNLKRIGLVSGMVLICIQALPAAAQSAAPPVEQDCTSGEAPHEVYASGKVGRGTIGHRLHFCVRNAAQGLKVFEQARSEVEREPNMPATMRASLLRQIEAKIALFRLGDQN